MPCWHQFFCFRSILSLFHLYLLQTLRLSVLLPRKQFGAFFREGPGLGGGLGIGSGHGLKALEIVETYNTPYCVECVKELHEQCKVPYSDMQSLQMCIQLAIENPSHLDRGIPSKTEVQAASEPCAELKQAIKSQSNVTNGLSQFQLKPEGMAGEDLFNHMVTFCRRTVPEEEHHISAHLAVDSLKDKHQKQLMWQSYEEMMLGNIM